MQASIVSQAQSFLSTMANSQWSQLVFIGTNQNGLSLAWPLRSQNVNCKPFFERTSSELNARGSYRLVELYSI